MSRPRDCNSLIRTLNDSGVPGLGIGLPLTVKSDDMQGRNEALNAIVKGKPIPRPGTPESFKVLMRELQSLGLDIGVYTDEGREVDLMQDVNPKRNTPSRPTYESLGTSEYAED